MNCFIGILFDYLKENKDSPRARIGKAEALQCGEIMSQKCELNVRISMTFHN